MRNMTSSNSPKKSASTETLLERLQRWFIAPSQKITEPDQRRQAALLSAFLLGMIGAVLAVQVLYTSPIGQQSNGAFPEIIFTGAALIIIYGVSRTKYVQLAAVLAVIAISLALFFTSLAHPESVLGGMFDYLMVPLWLGSLYLSAGGLTILIVAELAGLLIFPSLTRGITFTDILIGPFSFVFITSVVLIIMTRHRNDLERDRRAELAEKEEHSHREAAWAEALLRVADRLNAQLDLDLLLKVISDEVARALNTSVVLVSLYDRKANTLNSAAGSGVSPDMIKSIPALPKAVYDQTVKELGAAFTLYDLQVTHSLPYLNLFERLNMRSLAFVTMAHQNELIGSLTVITLGESRKFTEDELLLLQGLADQVVLAINNMRLYKDARRRLEHLQALRAIDIAISSNHDLQETLNILLDQITKQLQVDAAVILLLDETKGQLEFGARRGFQTSTLRFTSLRVGEGMAGRAAQQHQIVHISDLRSDPQTLAYAPSLAEEGFVSYHAAPLISKGQVKGVLEVFHRSLLDPDKEWLDFMEALAAQTAMAVESTTLFDDLLHTNEELFKAYDATIEGWSYALDLRDKETEGHTQRVTKLTLDLTRAFGFGGKELLYIRWGALLHDIGKMGVPDRILLKEGPLTEDEWVIMRQHPVFAHEMLRIIQYLRPALDIPYCHHEKWDGTGYPRGLKGEEIPLVARIFAVIDVWDALTSDRPYRAAWSREKTLAHIQEGAGHHFDPHVVEVFVDLIKQRTEG